MGVFIVGPGGKLVPMTEQPFELESLLQERLAEYPDLIAEDTEIADQGRRYVLVRREAGVAAEEKGGDRWSVDHLFLDEEGIPTLVEVKRSRNTQLRREVVGQMLDYAANAVAFWPVERIRSEFETSCQQRGVEPDDELQPVLREGEDAEGFWVRVKTNLEAQRLRLVFVSEQLPSELRRIIEYLNSQMRSTEVVGIEVKEYAGEGLKTLVSKTVGRTAAAQQAKGAGGLTEKQSLYAEFWPQVLGLLTEKHPSLAPSKAPTSGRHYLNIPSGRGGMWYSLNFTSEKKLRVELYIWLHEEDRVRKRYEFLEAKQSAVEERFGGSLSWSPLPGKKASRIAYYSDFAASIDENERWAEFQGWFVDSFARFRAAVQPEVDAIKPDAERS